MPEILRALVVVLVISTSVFFFVKKNQLVWGINPKAINARILAWYVVTLAAFFANNFWIFTAVVMLTLYVLGKKDPNPLGFLFFVLFALPLFDEQVPGLGIVNFLFNINYFRMLSLTVLLPAYLMLANRKNTVSFGNYWADKFLAAYLFYSLAQLFLHGSLTNTLRVTWGFFLDIYLPYFVASRSLKQLENFDDAIKSLLVSSSITGLIGFFEYIKGWLLYITLPAALGISWDGGGYLQRDGSVRAVATSGQAIVLGFILSVAFGFYLYIGKSISDAKQKYAIHLVILMGLMSSLSRGPWVGAAMMLFIAILLGPSPYKRLMKIGSASVIFLLMLMATPYGEKIIDYMPFFGTVDSENVEFRKKLLDNALIVIEQNLWFGSSNYMQTDELESLRSGGDGGIIDIVNSYIAITLSGGLIGLIFFCGFFGACGYSVFTARRLGEGESKYFDLGSILLAILGGILLIIYTVSSIYFIPIMYWIFGGICIAYTAMVKELPLNKKNVRSL